MTTSTFNRPLIMKQIIKDFNSIYFTSLYNETFSRNGSEYDLTITDNNIKIYHKYLLVATIYSLQDWETFKNIHFQDIKEKFKDSNALSSNWSEEQINYITNNYY